MGMAVDHVEYDEASKTMGKIAHENKMNTKWIQIPYWAGIVGAAFGAVVAVPMVFSETVARKFNHVFVTMDLPEPQDLETALEIGAWTWNWMEPILGTATFSLVAMQFARDNMKKLGLKPIRARLLDRRAAHLY